ncbi:hypothetical protein Hanom_Chr14g01334331 [Helianthus anomalus]
MMSMNKNAASAAEASEPAAQVATTAATVVADTKLATGDSGFATALTPVFATSVSKFAAARYLPA